MSKRSAGTRAAGAPPFQESEEVYRDQISSLLSERDGLIDRALARLKAIGIEPDPFFDRLFLDEVIVNAIVHGNRESPEKLVKLRLFLSPQRWGFEIENEGPGFDWGGLLRRLAAPVDDTRDSGRGLALIQASGAGLHFLDGGRRVVVTRSRSDPPAAGGPSGPLPQS